MHVPLPCICPSRSHPTAAGTKVTTTLQWLPAWLKAWCPVKAMNFLHVSQITMPQRRPTVVGPLLLPPLQRAAGMRKVAYDNLVREQGVLRQAAAAAEAQVGEVREQLAKAEVAYGQELEVRGRQGWG